MQKHLRCEAVDSDGHRCNKKATHVNFAKRKKAKDADPTIARHSAFGRSW